MSVKKRLAVVAAAVLCCLSWRSAQADLVAYWNLDGNLDNQAGTSVGALQLYGNASLSGAETAPGNGGSQSLSVDGADDYAYLDSAAGRSTLYSTLSGKFTVSVWGRSDVDASGLPGNLGYLWDIGSSHGTGAGTFFANGHGVATSGQIGAYYNSGTGISSGVAGEADTWYNVVMTGDGSTVRLYVNGNFVGSRSQGGSFNTGYDFRLGSEAKQNQREWVGYLDDVAVWNNTLPQSSIAQLTSGVSPADIGPVNGDRWVFQNELFDDSVGSTAVGPYKNHARWRYMTSSATTYDDPGDFSDFTSFVGGNTWQNAAAYPSLQISNTTLHPGTDPAVVAWESDFDGAVAYHFDPSMFYDDTTTAYQLLLWDASAGTMSVLCAREDLDANDAGIYGSTLIGVGDLIYFVLDNRTGNYDRDRTRLAATITAVPEPSLPILALGLVFTSLVLPWWRRRKGS